MSDFVDSKINNVVMCLSQTLLVRLQYTITGYWHTHFNYKVTITHTNLHVDEHVQVCLTLCVQTNVVFAVTFYLSL